MYGSLDNWNVDNVTNMDNIQQSIGCETSWGGGKCLVFITMQVGKYYYHPNLMIIYYETR